jgi:hypothetical protein
MISFELLKLRLQSLMFLGTLKGKLSRFQLEKPGLSVYGQKRVCLF